MKRHAWLWLGAVLITVLAVGSAAAGASIRISLSLQSTTAAVGETVSIDVMVSNVSPDPGLAAYDLILTFDPGVVWLDSLSDSGFITSGENLVICVTGEIDNSGGRVNATCEAIPLFGAPGVSTTDAVALLHASFTALAAGTSPLTLSGTLSGPEGTPIATTFEGGTLAVTAALPGAAVTPLATAGTADLPTAGMGSDDGRSLWPFLTPMSGLAAAGIAGSGVLLLIGRGRKR